MAFKNVNLTIEAYDKLKKAKQEGESFSKVVLRLAGSGSKVSQLAGILSEKEAQELEKGVRKVRAGIKVKAWHS